MPRINRPSPGNDPLLDRDRYLLRQAGVTPRATWGRRRRTTTPGSTCR
jgi:hypothetical protein